ncbi:hypothetical protein [Robinsoniella peoriensis]
MARMEATCSWVKVGGLPDLGASERVAMISARRCKGDSTSVFSSTGEAAA